MHKADSKALSSSSSTLLEASESKRRTMLPLRTSNINPVTAGLTLTSYVLPSSPNATVHSELRQFTPSDTPRCKAAAQLKRAAHSATPALRDGTAAPPGTVTPLLSAVLAPASRTTSHGARIASTMAMLAAIPVGDLYHTAPIARCNTHNLLGNALHAAILGACTDPHDYLHITCSLLDAGAHVDSPLVSTRARANSMSLPPTSAQLPNASSTSRSMKRSNTLVCTSAAARVVSDSDVDPSHWLHGATPMHLVVMFGLHHGRSIIPLIETLKKAGASMCFFIFCTCSCSVRLCAAQMVL